MAVSVSFGSRVEKTYILTFAFSNILYKSMCCTHGSLLARRFYVQTFIIKSSQQPLEMSTWQVF